jgi:hypothetical protein
MIKYITLIVSSILLTSCAKLNFDGNEFNSYLTIKEISENSIRLCGTPAVKTQVQDLQRIMNRQLLYITYREVRATPFIHSAREMKTVIDRLAARYNSKGEPSTAYCQEKLKNVALGATQLARELGRL